MHYFCYILLPRYCTTSAEDSIVPCKVENAHDSIFLGTDIGLAADTRVQRTFTMVI